MAENDKSFEVYETPEFLAEASHYLSEHELNALRYYLAANPFVGSPVEEWTGLQRLEWGNNETIEIIYLASQEKRFIALVELLGPDDSLSSPDSSDGKAAAEILSHLKKIGIGLTARELYDWLKDTFF